jgi:hypothetical protein
MFHRVDTTSGANTFRGIGCYLSPGDTIHFYPFLFLLDTTLLKIDKRWPASEAYRACRSSSGARSWTPARTACTGSTWGSPAHSSQLSITGTFKWNLQKLRACVTNYGVGIFNTFFCSQSTRWVAYIPSWWKISPAWWGWGVHTHPLFLYLPSRTKLQCTLQVSGQIHSHCFIF